MGAYPGKPQIWDYVESTENEALRAKLGMDKETGVLVTCPFSSRARLSLEAMGRDHADRRPAGGQPGQREDPGRSAVAIPIPRAQAGPKTAA